MTLLYDHQNPDLDSEGWVHCFTVADRFLSVAINTLSCCKKAILLCWEFQYILICICNVHARIHDLVYDACIPLVSCFVREFGQLNQLQCGVRWAKAYWAKTGRRQEKRRAQLRITRENLLKRGNQREKLGFLIISLYLIAKKMVGTAHLFKKESHQPPLLSLFNILWFVVI